MKKLLIKILPAFLILLVIGVAFAPQKAEASLVDFLTCVTGVTKCDSANLTDYLWGFLAELGNTVMSIFSYFLSLAGIVLNISILLTMNIKAIYDATPAIEQIWIVIRNISSIFIIFGLLYTSIVTILDIGKPNIKAFVGKIILAGLLINFSLFFTKIAIDASNLISLELYRAIVPNSKNINYSSANFGSLIGNTFSSGGISDIFMQSLKIPTIYNNKKGTITADTHVNYFTIVISTISGSMLMIMAALSFLGAAIAFIIRLVILLLLLGFSPIYFVGMIFPKIENDISGKWMKWLTAELLFMPVYLLFMYVALRFLSSQDGKGFFDVLNDSRITAGGAATNGVLLSMVGLLIQYTIAFILINIPLLAAVQVGGMGAKWGDSAQKWAGGMLGQHTIGRAAKWSSGKIAESGFATRNPNIAILANKAFGGVSGATYGGSKGGYDKRYKDYVKDRTEFGNKGIKLSEEEKRAYKESGLSGWSSRKVFLETNLATALRLSTSSNDQVRREATKKAAEYRNELEEMGKAEAKGGEEKYLEDKALREKKGRYSDTLGKSGTPVTTKANKEAAKAVRDELNKSEDKKIQDKIKKIMADADKESEPKEEGGK